MVTLETIMGQKTIVVNQGMVRKMQTVPDGASEAVIDAMLARAIRAERDRLLAECDWTRMDDCPLSDELRAAWATYRQAWRDVPQQVGFPREVNYPAAPRKGEADAD